MAGQITMTPDELHSRAQTYGSKAEDIRGILGELQGLQADLMDQWKGRASERFNDQFEQLKPKVNDFAQLLDEIQTQLQKTAQTVQEQDEALSQNFGLS